MAAKRLAQVGVFAICIVWVGWWSGYISTEPGSRTHPIRGRSMAPTLWGNYRVVTCPTCEFCWNIGVDTDLSNGGPCPHCGGPIGAESVSSLLPCDAVRLATAKDPQMGELVVLNKDQRLHVKRLVATSGDRVTLQGSRLLVNGKRVEDQLSGLDLAIPPALVVVDQDARREASRWRPGSTESGWQRNGQRGWSRSESPDIDWLIYGHRSAYHDDRPSRVYDDYPSNMDLRRKLYPVDRFIVSGVAESPMPVRLRVAIWSTTGVQVATVEVEGATSFQVSSNPADRSDGATPESKLPVDAENPVAIRVVEGVVTLGELTIERKIEYRLRPHDDHTRYPLTIPPGNVFVLGDNVPLSVDSRDYGPVPIESIAAMVRHVEAEPPGRVSNEP